MDSGQQTLNFFFALWRTVDITFKKSKNLVYSFVSFSQMFEIEE